MKEPLVVRFINWFDLANPQTFQQSKVLAFDWATATPREQQLVSAVIEAVPTRLPMEGPPLAVGETRLEWRVDQPPMPEPRLLQLRPCFRTLPALRGRVPPFER